MRVLVELDEKEEENARGGKGYQPSGPEAIPPGT